MSAPTPGPWRLESTRNGFEVVWEVDPSAEDSAWGRAEIVGHNAKANARLIASAPDLLKALKVLLKQAEWFDMHVINKNMYGGMIKEIIAARVAIAKAEVKQ